MHITCPHCSNPIEIVKALGQRPQRDEIACPSCGSSFQPDNGSTAAWAEPMSKRFGRFELLEAVGQGAFGTVYKAHDAELDRVVAVKVPRAGNLAGAADLDRFLREARSVAQLRHPSIVTVHEVGQADGVPYLVSEFVQGVTLADWLTARKPEPRQAAELIANVAEALQVAHEQRIVHRDVKPSNIMIVEATGDGGKAAATMLMDFGLAKRDAGEITMTLEGQVLGTPAFMSPEQAHGDAHQVDGRSDIYSLGVILYQMLTGELPFRGTTRMLLHQVLHDDPRSPRSLNDRIPRDLETICLTAMAKEPSRRYESAAALVADLRRFLAGAPINARPVSQVEKGWKWCRRNRATAGLLAALAVSLILGLAGTTWFGVHARAAAIRAETALDERNAASKRERDIAFRLVVYLKKNPQVVTLPSEQIVKRFLESAPDVTESDFQKALASAGEAGTQGAGSFLPGFFGD